MYRAIGRLRTSESYSVAAPPVTTLSQTQTAPWLNIVITVLKLLSSLALQGSGSQMVNNCNLIKYVYRINSNGIVTGISSVFRHLARNVYFAGLDVELLERDELLSDILWERDYDKTGDTQFMDFVIERLSAH